MLKRINTYSYNFFFFITRHSELYYISKKKMVFTLFLQALWGKSRLWLKRKRRTKLKLFMKKVKKINQYTFRHDSQSLNYLKSYLKFFKIKKYKLRRKKRLKLISNKKDNKFFMKLKNKFNFITLNKWKKLKYSKKKIKLGKRGSRYKLEKTLIIKSFMRNLKFEYLPKKGRYIRNLRKRLKYSMRVVRRFNIEKLESLKKLASKHKLVTGLVKKKG